MRSKTFQSDEEFEKFMLASGRWEVKSFNCTCGCILRKEGVEGLKCRLKWESEIYVFP
jgi:hypothetical protein